VQIAALMADRTSFNTAAKHRFRIRLAGIVSDHWSGRFAGVELRHSTAGDSLVTGQAIDAAALFGVLRSIETLGVQLISIITWPADGRGDESAGSSFTNDSDPLTD
jgi:hypothetical protein